MVTRARLGYFLALFDTRLSQWDMADAETIYINYIFLLWRMHSLGPTGQADHVPWNRPAAIWYISILQKLGGCFCHLYVRGFPTIELASPTPTTESHTHMSTSVCCCVFCFVFLVCVCVCVCFLLLLFSFLFLPLLSFCTPFETKIRYRVT